MWWMYLQIGTCLSPGCIYLCLFVSMCADWQLLCLECLYISICDSIQVSAHRQISMWYAMLGHVCFGMYMSAFSHNRRHSEVPVALISEPVKEMAYSASGIQGHLPASSLPVPSHFSKLPVFGFSYA